MQPKYHYMLIVFTIIFFILGRISDDMNWYSYDGIAPNNFQALAVLGLSISLSILLIIRIDQKQGLKIILWSSQLKFIIPWSLVILFCYMIWQIFGCYKHGEALQGQQMDYNGCILETIVLVLTNINYSLICNQLGQIPLLITFQMTLFAEIIYSGFLLIKFINGIEDKQQDYCIIFVSIFISWQVLCMDLIYRGSFEDKIHQQRHQKLQKIVSDYHSKCRSHVEVRSTCEIFFFSSQSLPHD